MSIVNACRAGLLAALVMAGSSNAHEPLATQLPGRPLHIDARPAAAVVEEFSQALQSGDLPRAAALLASEVVVLESGGAERSRDEYLAHHAPADAAFLTSAHVQPLARYGQANGDLAWIASESEIHVTKEGAAATLLSTETMVLKRIDGAWKIVHIHWSSRAKKE